MSAQLRINDRQLHLLTKLFEWIDSNYNQATDLMKAGAYKYKGQQ